LRREGAVGGLVRLVVRFGPGGPNVVRRVQVHVHGHGLRGGAAGLLILHHGVIAGKRLGHVPGGGAQRVHDNRYLLEIHFLLLYLVRARRSSARARVGHSRRSLACARRWYGGLMPGSAQAAITACTSASSGVAGLLFTCAPFSWEPDTPAHPRPAC